ncbi:MAG TPA: amidohydrolase [Acidimicrobiia bacterium]|nr:amidohydrolase [Acidimicrobiia bacterium]
MSGPDQLAGLVEEIAPQAIELRRLLHRYPEPSHQEFKTTELIREFVTRLGLGFNDRGGKTGGWVDIGTNPGVGFRADIDGLPIREPFENTPRSDNEGWMHACGHDAHAAIAAGVVAVLERLDLDVGVRVLFQPAEESWPGGASDLVAEGLVDDLGSILAYHVDPTLPAGRIGARVGPITAGADTLTVVVHGPGGHSSRPHRTVDLISAAARVAIELPVAIRDSIDPRSPVVAAFGSIHGGDAANVIPTEVTLRGTVRTLDSELWDVLPALVDKSLGSILAISGARYTLDYQRGIAPVINDERVVVDATTAIEATLGSDSVVPTETSMGGEDFSSFLTRVPGALLRLGSASGGGDLHSASFSVNENSIPFGIHAAVAALLGLGAGARR